MEGDLFFVNYIQYKQNSATEILGWADGPQTIHLARRHANYIRHQTTALCGAQYFTRFSSDVYSELFTKKHKINKKSIRKAQQTPKKHKKSTRKAQEKHKISTRKAQACSCFLFLVSLQAKRSAACEFETYQMHFAKGPQSRSKRSKKN